MKLTFGVAALSLGSLLFSSAAFPQERENADVLIDQTDKAFTVKYNDGSKERYLVRYAGYLYSHAWQDGHPAIPAEFKFTDTRQCHWNLQGRIERLVVLAHKSGKQQVFEPLSVRWNTAFTNKGSDFVLTRLQSENCSTAWPRYQSDQNNYATASELSSAPLQRRI